MAIIAHMSVKVNPFLPYYTSLHGRKNGNLCIPTAKNYHTAKNNDIIFHHHSKPFLLPCATIKVRI